MKTIKSPTITQEEMEKIQQNRYNISQQTVENMSYWLPRIQKSVETSNSGIKIPETKIIPLPFERWVWLNSDNYKKEAIEEFNTFLFNEAKEFLERKNKLFMKTGLFSDKFCFKRTIVTKDVSIGENFLDIYYSSMIVGADKSAEVVLREFIESKMPLEQIYNGMNLFTEFRVFYDFDEKKVLGVSNYWHPEVMERYLHGDDHDVYLKAKERIVNTFNEHKQMVAEKTSEALKEVTDLHGSWSVDVLLNIDELWLIDMARMFRSAMVEQMEVIK